jgi:hypothetical protein
VGQTVIGSYHSPAIEKILQQEGLTYMTPQSLPKLHPQFGEDLALKDVLTNPHFSIQYGRGGVHCFTMDFVSSMQQWHHNNNQQQR